MRQSCYFGVFGTMTGRGMVPLIPQRSQDDLPRDPTQTKPSSRRRKRPYSLFMSVPHRTPLGQPKCPPLRRQDRSRANSINLRPPGPHLHVSNHYSLPMEARMSAYSYLYVYLQTHTYVSARICRPSFTVPKIEDRLEISLLSLLMTGSAEQ